MLPEAVRGDSNNNGRRPANLHGETNGGMRPTVLL